MDLTCVTRNLGRRPVSQGWVDAMADANAGIDLMLLQETPQGMRVPDGFMSFPGPESSERKPGACRSLILLRDEHSERVEESSYLQPTLLADYVASATLRSDGGEPLYLINVHASPRPVEFDEAPHAHLRRKAESRVWHSDVISGELLMLAESRRVLAVGDFNEAMSWDDKYQTGTSAEFFDRLKPRFVDVTAQVWGGEFPTQTGHKYQVDRLFRTPDVQVHLEPNEFSLGTNDDLSDHLPIRFTLSL